MLKILFSDIDGTLIPRPGVLSDPYQGVIAPDSIVGAEFSLRLNTGRPFDECRVLIGKLNITEPSIFDGGSAILDPRTGSALAVRYLDPAAINLIHAILHTTCHSAKYTWNGRLIQGWPPDNQRHRVTSLLIHSVESDATKVLKLDPHCSIEIVRLEQQSVIVARPHGITKGTLMEQALACTRGRTTGFVVGAGDSAADVPFLKLCDQPIVVDYGEQLSSALSGGPLPRILKPANGSRQCSELLRCAAELQRPESK